MMMMMIDDGSGGGPAGVSDPDSVSQEPVD